MDAQTITAITALAAVLVGPAVTLYITKKQINSNVVSTNRQQWINSLREETARYVRDCIFIALGYKTDAIDGKESWHRFEEMNLIYERVRLLLNPKEEDHKELIRLYRSALNKTLDGLKNKDADHSEMLQAANRITNQAQLILKQEWVRVKSGK